MKNVLDFNQPDTARAVGGELAGDVNALARRVGTGPITDVPTLSQCVIDRQDIAAAAKKVEAFFDPFISSAFKLHRMLCDRKNEILAPLLRADALLRGHITDYKIADDKARRQREADQAEQQRRDRETAAAREAADLEQAGEHALAAAVVEEAIAAPAPVVVLPDAKKAVDGLKFTRRWLWRVIPASAQPPPPLVPREYLCLDEKKIGAYVRAMKATGQIPGIEIYYVDDPVR